jgi:hypothetical protein
LEFPQFHKFPSRDDLLPALEVAAFSDDETSLEPLGQRRII